MAMYRVAKGGSVYRVKKGTKKSSRKKTYRTKSAALKASRRRY